MDRLEWWSGDLDVRSEMDWRLQGAGLTAGIIFAELPNFFSPNYTGNQASFVSSWNTILSVMQYLVIVSLALVVLGIVRRGPVGRPSAWIQMFISFGLGSWMLVGLLFSGISQAWLSEDCCRQLLPAVAPLRGLLTIGLLIPTLSFGSALTWLFWDGRRRPGAGIEILPVEIRRRLFSETSEFMVASVVASIMLVFGLTIIFAASSTLILIAAASMIGLSIMVFVLEVAQQAPRPRRNHD
jgi:hypothetical protein